MGGSAEIEGSARCLWGAIPSERPLESVSESGSDRRRDIVHVVTGTLNINSMLVLDGGFDRRWNGVEGLFFTV